MAIALRYSARSDVGLVRSNNQDSGYAGPHLLVVCDGMGGHVGGDVASSLAIAEMVALDGESHGVDDALEQLSDAIADAHETLLTRVEQEPALTGMGTTVTALLRAGNRLALGHIGDSRAYLLREGELVQLTHDHTFVQSLVDEGRLTLEEAEQHPQRSVIMRVLSDLVPDATPDLSMREAREGDRYLLCSDGLSGVVSYDTLRQSLAEQESPEGACEQLVALALRAGAPDNVTVIVADIVTAGTAVDDAPVVVGAAAKSGRGGGALGAAAGSAAARAAALTGGRDGEDDDHEDDERPHPRRRRRLLTAAMVLVLVLGGAAGGLWWLSGQYFVGVWQGRVGVFQGLPDDLGPISLSRLDHLASVDVADLPPVMRDQVSAGIVADSLDDAEVTVTHLRDQATACRVWRESGGRPTTAGSPSPSPSPSGTSSPSPASASPTPSGTASPAKAGSTPRPTATGATIAPPASGIATPSPSTTAPSTTAPSTAPATPAVPPGDCDGIG